MCKTLSEEAYSRCYINVSYYYFPIIIIISFPALFTLLTGKKNTFQGSSLELPRGPCWGELNSQGSSGTLSPHPPICD